MKTNSLSTLDDFISKEYGTSHRSCSDFKKNKYTVNSDSDILTDYTNNFSLYIKRNGEFLSLSDPKNNRSIVINIFDLFKNESKPKKNFFKKLFS